jgi:hypothetical protein
MSVTMKMLHVTVTLPAVVMSTVLAVIAFTLLPTQAGLAGFLAVVVLLVALFSGHLEAAAVRTIGGAREPRGSELVVLTPLMRRLGELGISAQDLYLTRTRRSQRPAVVAGHGSLVMSWWLVEATYRGELTEDEAIALVVHAVGRNRARPRRFELALAVWSAPWRAVLAVAGTIGSACAWMPLVRPAWRLRAIVGIACVVQSTAGGHAVPGLLGGLFIALTYVVPAAAQAIELRVEAAADAFVLAHGLAPAFICLLQRGERALPPERLQRLQHPVPRSGPTAAPQRPALRLVQASTSISQPHSSPVSCRSGTPEVE